MKIIAVGGGEIGRPGTSIETEKIDKETIRLSGKKHPKLLFVPTASSDSEGYIKVVKDYFGERLECSVDVLRLSEKLSTLEIKKKIFGADIIYVGGGNTLKMMKIWRRHGIDALLVKAAQKGIVLSGVSAGAICWFRQGNSDSRRTINPKSPLIKVRGLNLIPALCCPHYNGEKDRQPSLKKMMVSTSGVAIALDNCAAFEMVDDSYRVLTSKSGSGAYRVYWKKGVFHHESIPTQEVFVPIADLFKK